MVVAMERCDVGREFGARREWFVYLEKVVDMGYFLTGTGDEFRLACRDAVERGAASTSITAGEQRQGSRHSYRRSFVRTD